MARKHRRRHGDDLKTIPEKKTNEFAGYYGAYYRKTSPPTGKGYRSKDLLEPDITPEVKNALAKVGAEIRIDQEIPYVIIYDSNLRKELGDYGIIAEDIGSGRQKNRQFHESRDPSAISVYDLLYGYQLGLIGPKSTNRHRTYNAILEWGVYQDPDFMEKLSVYMTLRENGLIVMSGTRYGTDFTIYVESPEEFHSKDRDKDNRLESDVALIDVGSIGTNIEIPETIKGEHLARSIGKTYMIANASGKRDANGHLKQPSPLVTFRVLDAEELGIDSTKDISALVQKRMDGQDQVPWELRSRF